VENSAKPLPAGRQVYARVPRLQAPEAHADGGQGFFRSSITRN